MVCRILRSNPHRGGVASRPGYPESDLDGEGEAQGEAHDVKGEDEGSRPSNEADAWKPEEAEC
jgi:hypothetical protein